METLTGKRRHRVVKRWLRSPVLVLQVEVHHKGSTYGSLGDWSDYDFLRWRDAKLEDLTEVQSRG